jgi:hypothetical protein
LKYFGKPMRRKKNIGIFKSFEVLKQKTCPIAPTSFVSVEVFYRKNVKN